MPKFHVQASFATLPCGCNSCLSDLLSAGDWAALSLPGVCVQPSTHLSSSEAGPTQVWGTSLFLLVPSLFPTYSNLPGLQGPLNSMQCNEIQQTFMETLMNTKQILARLRRSLSQKSALSAQSSRITQLCSQPRLSPRLRVAVKGCIY